MNAPDAVPSPCTSVCRMDATLGSAAERLAGGLCAGCLRTIDEIVAWGGADADRKRAILAAIDARRVDAPPR